jgi:hypothetical protein
MAKQAGLSAKQREDIDAALLEYGAHLTEDDHIARGGKVMSVRLEVKGGRLRVEGGGNLLASYPVSRAGKGISDFVKAFWFWKKAPTEALRGEGPQIEHSSKKSPAQLQHEIDKVLAGPVNRDTVEDLVLTPTQRAYVSAVEEDVRRYPNAYKSYIRTFPGIHSPRPWWPERGRRTPGRV